MMSTKSEVHTADQLPLPRYGLDAPPARAGLSDGYDRTIDPGTGYSLKDKNEAKPDKTEHGFRKSAKNRGQGYKRIENGSKTEISGSTRQRLRI
ncbi:hypothetical protein Tco_0832641 [Tanacetum coccineum]